LNDARHAGESSLLELRIRRKAFRTAAGKSLEVLRDVSLTLAAGEVCALVGPSGCGKTTMLRIIAGLDPDYDGLVHRPPASRLAMVFQEPRLLPWRDVTDNVRLFAPLADDADVAALFDILGLTSHAGHFPGELSLGLARRVALARAFAVKPDLLLLDEPFVSLDDALARRLREELALLVDRRSIATLLVTHDIEEAVQLADRILLLSPRPAQIVADLPVLTRRAARTDDDCAAIKAAIAQRLADYAHAAATRA
jgi:NitT/TauT family transport system ATP-binding protein